MRIAAGPSLYFALAMVATAAMFLAVGAVTSQLAATRRQAASFGAAFLGVSYALRLIADAGVGLHGLIWAIPIRLGRGAASPSPLPNPLPSCRSSASPRCLQRSPCTSRASATSGRASCRTGARTAPPPAALRSDGPRHPPAAGQGHRLVGGDRAVGAPLRTRSQSRPAPPSRARPKRCSPSSVPPVPGPMPCSACASSSWRCSLAFVAAGQITAARAEESEGMLDHILIGPVPSDVVAGRTALGGPHRRCS